LLVRVFTPPIHTSCSHHLEQVVRALLEAKADPEKQTLKGNTALIFAAQNGHDLCARALLENEAAVNSQNKKGWTALMYAAQNGHQQVRFTA
jgi:uncharacterized protein